MKKLFYRTLIVVLSSMLFLQACKKNPDNQNSESTNELTLAEAKAEYNRAVSSGLPLTPGKYTGKMNPNWGNLSGYTTKDGKKALYVTLAFNKNNNALLRMIVIKDHGKINSTLVEAVPDLSQYKRFGYNYAKLTGKYIFYNLKGEVRGIISVKDGARLSESNRPKVTTEAALEGPMDDQDDDGVVNKDDKCPGTPAGVMVTEDGCPRVNDLDEVAIESPNPNPNPHPGWVEPGGAIPPGGNDGGDGGPGTGGGGDSGPSLTLTLDLNTAVLCGIYPTLKVGNGYTGGIQNLGFVMTIRSSVGSTTIPVVIGSSCFSIGGPGMDALLASTVITGAYNTAVTEVMYMAKNGIINLDAASLRIALTTTISANMALLPGGSYSAGNCAGPNVPTTIASYNCAN